MQINTGYVKDIENNLIQGQIDEHKVFNEEYSLSGLVEKSIEVITVLDNNKATAMWGIIKLDESIVNFWIAVTDNISPIKRIRGVNKYLKTLKDNYSLIISVARPENTKVLKWARLQGFIISSPIVFDFSEELFCRLDLKGNK